MRVFEFIFTAYFILFLCGAPFSWGPGANCPLCAPLLAALISSIRAAANPSIVKHLREIIKCKYNFIKSPGV